MEEKFKILYDELTSIGTEKRFPSHKELICIGESVNTIYIVKAGGLVLNHVHPTTGKERAINFFIPEFHPIATVSHALVLNEPSKYSLKTFTNTILIEINKTQLNHFSESPQLSSLFQEHGLKTMIDKNEIRANLVSLSSKEMLKYLHTEYPHILLKVPSKYVADFLGITPQWLSKLKHSF